MALIEASVDGATGTICLDHFAKRNALSAALSEEIAAALSLFAEQKLRAVILRARPGVKIWSAGHDVDELPQGRRDPLGWSDPLRKLIRAVEGHGAPVLALVEGGVWGGACELALACDIVITTPDATFALTPAKLGVPYNVSGMATFMKSAPMGLLREMVFTARPISAERALSAGLINHIVPSTEIEAFAREMAAEIGENAPLTVAVLKEELRILANAHPMSPEGFERIQGLRRVVYDSADYRRGNRGVQGEAQARLPRRVVLRVARGDHPDGRAELHAVALDVSLQRRADVALGGGVDVFRLAIERARHGTDFERAAHRDLQSLADGGVDLERPPGDADVGETGEIEDAADALRIGERERARVLRPALGRRRHAMAHGQKGHRLPGIFLRLLPAGEGDTATGFQPAPDVGEGRMRDRRRTSRRSAK